VLTKLGTVEDIERARAALQALFEDGRVSLEALEAATLELNAAQARLAATTGDVADAFKLLGVTSSAELKVLSDEALRAFETIRDSGTATTADLEAAWRAYAERAIASGDHVAAQTARQEAAALGLLDAYERLAAQKARGADSGTRAAEAAEREASATQSIADNRERQADAEQRISDEALRRRGVTREEYESGITRRQSTSYANIFNQVGTDLGAFAQMNRGVANFGAMEQGYLAWLREQGHLGGPLGQIERDSRTTAGGGIP
jgi:hypothetical protein